MTNPAISISEAQNAPQDAAYVFEWTPVSKAVWSSYMAWLRRTLLWEIDMSDKQDTPPEVKARVPRLRHELKMLEMAWGANGKRQMNRIEQVWFLYFYYHCCLYEKYKGAGCWSGEHAELNIQLLRWRNARLEALGGQIY